MRSVQTQRSTPPPRVAGFSSLFRCCHHGRQFLFVVPVFHASAFLRPFAPRSLPASPRLRTLCLPPGGSSGAIALNAAWPRRVSLIIAGGLPAIPSPTIGASTGDRPAASGLTPPRQAWPVSRKLARPRRPNRVHGGRPRGHPGLRTGRSRSAALHPALLRRSYGSIPHGSSPHKSGLPPLCLLAFSGARAWPSPATAKKSFRTWSSRRRTRRCWCWFTEGVHGFHGLTRIKSKKVMAVSDS